MPEFSNLGVYPFEFDSAPEPTDMVGEYLYEHGQEVSKSFALDLKYPAKPLAGTIVMIPVAAHTEAAHILPSMEQYSLQAGCKPFSLCLYLNSPLDADPDLVSRTISQIGKAKKRYPQLDIRYTFSFGDNDTIGQIRKDLWDSVLRVAYEEGAFEDQFSNVLGVNHDIDTEWISPKYIANIQKYYRARQMKFSTLGLTDFVNSPRFTQVRHAYPYETHPNIAKGLVLNDAAYFQYAPTGVFEEGVVVPMTTYAKKKGFSPESMTFETAQLIKGTTRGIPGTSMATSPRRYIDRVSEYGFDGIWTDDSFGPNDPCRKEELLRPDITSDELQDQLFDVLEYHSELFCTGKVRRALAKLSLKNSTDLGSYRTAKEKIIIDKTQYGLALQRRMLDRVLGSNLLSEIIDKPYATSLTNKIEMAFLPSSDADSQ
jgi:hypothetical protein